MGGGEIMASSVYEYFIDKINEEEENSLKSEFYSSENIENRLKKFTNDDGKIDIVAFNKYMVTESIHLNAILLANVLTALVEDGVIDSPLKDD